MKNFSALLCSLTVSAFVVIALPSCVMYDETIVHSGGGGHSSRSPYSSDYRSGPRSTQYRDSRGYSPYEQSRSPFYNNSNDRYRTGSSRYNSYDDHRGHDDHDDRKRYDHRDDRSRNESKKDDNLKHNPSAYRIAGGSTGSKTKPKGYHSVSWYKSRGYDVNKLTLKNEKGQTYKKKR